MNVADKKPISELLRLYSTALTHDRLFDPVNPSSATNAANSVSALCREGFFKSAEKRGGKWVLDEDEFLQERGPWCDKYASPEEAKRAITEARERQERYNYFIDKAKKKEVKAVEKGEEERDSMYREFGSSNRQLTPSDRTGFASKCPYCSSTNIQSRDMAISGGRTSTVGLGVSSSGGVAVGIGRSRTGLSKKAQYKSTEDNFLLFTFLATIAGFVFGAVGWLIGAIFDAIFGTELVAYFIFIPFAIGSIGALILFQLIQNEGISVDKERKWICLTCGDTFS